MFVVVLIGGFVLVFGFGVGVLIVC